MAKVALNIKNRNTQQVTNEATKIGKRQEELNSTGGNHLCVHFLREPRGSTLPANFQSRRSDAISDRDILLTMTGMLCNSRTDFTDVGLYCDDTVFNAQSFGIGGLPFGVDVTPTQWTNCPHSAAIASVARRLNQSLLSGRTFGTVRTGHLGFWFPSGPLM